MVAQRTSLVGERPHQSQSSEEATATESDVGCRQRQPDRRRGKNKALAIVDRRTDGQDLDIEPPRRRSTRMAALPNFGGPSARRLALQAYLRRHQLNMIRTKR
jgi:hypothetical protein